MMKFLKIGLFCFMCGVIGTLLKILAQQNGVILSAIFGFIEGSLIAFTILNFDTCKNFFMGKPMGREYSHVMVIDETGEFESVTTVDNEFVKQQIESLEHENEFHRNRIVHNEKLLNILKSSLTFAGDKND